MKQTRLEALRLAVGFGAGPDEALAIAETFANYISHGPGSEKTPAPKRGRVRRQPKDGPRQSAEGEDDVGEEE